MLWLLFSVFAAYLLVLSIIDLRIFQLPDELTLSLLWLGLLANAFNVYTTSSAAVLGASSAYLSFVGINKIYYLLRKKEGLGRGDAKLLAALGAWLGWKILPLLVFIAAIMNLIWAMFALLKHRKLNLVIVRYFPFGPALSISGAIMMIFKILNLQ